MYIEQSTWISLTSISLLPIKMVIAGCRTGPPLLGAASTQGPIRGKVYTLPAQYIF